MTRIERTHTQTHQPSPDRHVIGRFFTAVWQSQFWLRWLMGAVVVILVMATTLAYFGIVNLPIVSSVVYQPLTPIREVSAVGLSALGNGLDGQMSIAEGQLTTLLRQLKSIPGSVTVFYDLQAVVEPNRVQVYGRLFQADGYYRFTTDVEPVVAQGHLKFKANKLQVQKIGLPKSYIQPLLDQLATASNVTILNATVRQATAESGRINLTLEPYIAR